MNNKVTEISDDTSQFISGKDIKIEVGGLMSEIYSNITPLRNSGNSPFSLHTATRYGKRYLLKSIRPEYAADTLYQVALAKEFELGINADHNCIRRTIGFEHIDGLGNTIVLEYIDGENLDQAIARNHIHPKQFRYILEQLADALDYLHCRQILHRDIKPANILITYSRHQVKLIDFSHSDSDSFVILKNAAGSERYIAPELKDGNTPPSVRSDIYSFGVIAKAMAVIAGDHVLMDIARRCCATNPDARPESFAAIFETSAKSRLVNRTINILESRVLTLILVISLIAIWLFILFSTKKIP